MLKVWVIKVNGGNILEVAVKWLNWKKGKTLEVVVLELNGGEMLIGGGSNLSEWRAGLVYLT